MTTTARGLWGHKDFLTLWTAQGVSSFGARIAREGLPMAAVITLKAGPGALGLFAALTLGAQAVMGPFAGALADRVPKRPLMIGADLARAAVLTLIPAMALLGRLSLIEIYVAGVAMGALNVIFDVVDHAFLPSVVDPADLVDANSKLGTTDAIAEVGGPALAGALFQLIAPPMAVAVNAATYLFSAACLARLGPSRRPAAPSEEEGFDLTSGVRTVLAHPLVRPLWLASLARAFFGSFFYALYIVYCIGVLKLTPAMVGITVAGGGVGGLLGAALAPWLIARLGVGPAIAATGLLGGAMALIVPLAGGAPLLAMTILTVGQVLGDGLQTAAEIGAVSVRQAVLPPEALGRAGGAFASGQGAMGVAGALIGGALGATIGPRESLLIAALGFVAAAGLVIASPLRRLRDLAPA
jgi:predicted MFS family arabinose efflux permease